jgi:two-component system chemotaxis response regulator CheB
VANRGGATVVQDPGDALYPNMPRSAIAHVAVDHIATADAIGGLLAELCKTEIGDVEAPVSPLMDIEADLAMMDDGAMHQDERPGQPSGFSCPDCNGVLWEIRDGELVRYRCRVGHAWSAESLFGEQALQLDSALWMALRGLEEKAALARTMSERARERGNPLTASRFLDQEAEAARAAALIRSMLEAHVGTHDDESEAGA